jgi:hypothetical protein
MVREGAEAGIGARSREMESEEEKGVFPLSVVLRQG